MISYRQSTPSDALPVSKLLLEVSFITRFLYGSTYPERDLLDKIAAAFKEEHGKSSYKNIYVAEATIDNQKKIVGLINYYHAADHKIDEKMKSTFPENVLTVLQPLYASIIPDSLYISALIVDANYRNQKLGPRLIQHSIAKAREANLQDVCLHVWEDNQRGVAFYKKNHFKFYEHFKLNTDSMLLPPSKTIWLTGISAQGMEG